MAVDYIAASGQDLDDVFDPYVTGTSPAATGFILSSGIDLNTRYAPIIFGSAASATGLLLSNGNDLNTLFAAKNTAAYWPAILPWAGLFSENVSTPPASVSLNFRTDGNLILSTVSGGGQNLGRYLPLSGSPSDFVIRMTLASGLTATSTNISSSNQSLSVDRFVTFTQSTEGERLGAYDITISRASNLSDNRTARSEFSPIVSGGA